MNAMQSLIRKIATNSHLLTIQVFLSLVIVWIFSSCQKSPINGDLDGQWQIVSVEPEVTPALINSKLYYCFSLHVCQLTYYDNGIVGTGNMKYDSETSSLYLDFPYLKTDYSMSILKQYGIYENPVTFTIEHLDSKSLVMRDGETVVTLRKF